MTTITEASCAPIVAMSSHVTIRPRMNVTNHAAGYASVNGKEASYETTAILD